MKNKFLLGSLFAFSMGTAQAQQYFNGTPVAPSTDAYRDGKTGFGMNSAPTTNMVEVQTSSWADGVRIIQTNQGACGLHLDNNSTGGNQWSAYSFGYNDASGAGNFGIQNSTSSYPDLLITGSGGNVGMGTITPASKLEVSTSGWGDGVRVTQTYQGACALHLDNNSTGGNQWSAYSYGYGDANGAGNFGIQNSAKSTPDLKIYPSGNIEVGGNTAPVSTRFYVGGGSSVYCGLFQNTSSSNGTYRGLSASNNNYSYTGVSIGLDGYATSVTGAGTETRGVLGQGVGGYDVYGGYFMAYSGTNNIGVYASGGSWAGYFSGSVYSSSGYVSSDKRFKTDIKHIENASQKLQKLHGYTYKFKTEEFKDRNFENTEQIGLIAQELKDVFPNLVKDDGKGYLAVNYIALIPVMIEGFKEQQTTIEQQAQQLNDQQKQIDELKTMVQSLAGHAPATSAQTVELSDKNAIVLNQNVPNPFAESTVISYNIPTDFAKAQLIFSTDGGKVIRVIDITTKGEGRLNVFANDLTSGMYTYTLVVDGKTIETKRMIKQ